MATVWENCQTLPRNDTIRISLTLWNISFLVQNSTKINVTNQNNCEKFKGYHYVSLNIFTDCHFDRYAISWMVSLKVMVSNTVLEVPNFEILYVNYSSNQLHNIFLKTFYQCLEFFLLDKIQEILQCTKKNKT